MSQQQKKKTPVQFVTEIESVRLTNWFIRIAWKATAGLLVITARLLTTLILAAVRIWRRHRVLR